MTDSVFSTADTYFTNRANLYIAPHSPSAGENIPDNIRNSRNPAIISVPGSITRHHVTLSRCRSNVLRQFLPNAYFSPRLYRDKSAVNRLSSAQMKGIRIGVDGISIHKDMRFSRQIVSQGPGLLLLSQLLGE